MPKEFSSVAVLHTQAAVTERAQTPAFHSLCFAAKSSKLLLFMQITGAFSIGATRPHCVHHLVHF